MKNPELAESKEKSNFRFFQFLFFELWSFLYSKLPIFDEFLTITRKIKIGKIEKLIFHSFQHIAGVCISLVGKSPSLLVN